MMSSRYHYVTSGLSIASDVAIPGLPSCSSASPHDVDVCVREFDRARAALGVEEVRYISRERVDGMPQLVVWSGSSGAHRFRYSDGTEFIVDEHAARIAVRWVEPMTDADAAVYLLGPVLGFVMRLRGMVPLHASAVLIGDTASLFLGSAGAGKSTTAAAFGSLGYPVLSDDLVRIVAGNDAFFVHPSHPRLSVWPDSAIALFGLSDLPRLAPTYDKRYLDRQSGYRFHDVPTPLAEIYVLRDGDSSSAFETRALRPREALMALVSNTYGNYLLNAPMRRLEFDLLAQVAQCVPVRALSFGDDIMQLIDRCRELARRRLLDSTDQSL